MVNSRQSCLKNLLEITIMLFLFESIVMAMIYVLDRDSFAESVLTAFVAQLLLGLVAVPVFLIELVWIYWQRKRRNVHRAIMVWVWRNKAYLPVLAKDKKYFVDIAPVHIATLSRDDLIRAMNRVVEDGHQHETILVENGPPDPLLAVTQVSSRKKLMSEATLFIVRWTPKTILFDIMNGPDNFQQSQTFPLDTSLDTIASAILDYLNTDMSNFNEDSDKE